MWAISRFKSTLMFAGLLCGALAVEGRAGWSTNLEAAKREATATKRLVLVHFWTTWCGPCKRLEKTVLSQSNVIETIEQEYVLVKLDAEKHPEVARGYGVDRFPTDVVISPQGALIRKMVSPPTATEYVGEMSRIALAARQPAASPPVAAVQPAAPGVEGQSLDPNQHLSATPEMAMSMPAAGAAGIDYAADYSAPPADPARTAAAPVAPAYGRRPSGDWSRSAGTAMASDDADAGPAGGAGSSSQEDVAASDPASLADIYDRPPADAPAASSNVPSAKGPPAVAVNHRPNDRASIPPAGVRPAPANRSQVQQLPPGSPPLGLDGFCPVHLAEGRKWLRGDTRFGAIHRGRTYLFGSESCQKKFLADPDRFSPVLQGNDVVVAVEQGTSVPGRREFGVFYGDRVYLFSSEATRDRFERDHHKLAEAAAKLVR